MSTTREVSRASQRGTGYRSIAFITTLALLIASVALLVAASPAYAAIEDMNEDERSAIEILNQARVERGLPALKLSPILTEAAEWMSADLASVGALSHTDSMGRSLGPRVHSFGYPSNAYIRENIAYGYRTGAAVMQGWMNSPGHRTNNLATDVSVAGIAVVDGPDGTPYWTLVLGSHQDSGTVTPGQPSATPTPTPSPTPSPTPTPTGNAPIGSGAAMFSQPFPPPDGVGLNTWNGGPLHVMTTGAFNGGATALFMTIEGRFVGFVIGAPAFVNQEFVQAFPGGDVPAGTIILIVR